MAKKVPPSTAESADQVKELRRHHARLGWYLLAFFGLLGLILETLHALKWQAYVGVDSATRREMWTLAHAHGTLLAIVHLCFSAALAQCMTASRSMRLVASRLLSSASVLMPTGFFLGGVQFYAGDPGLGILLVPIGALALIVGAVVTGWAIQTKPKTS